MGLIARALEMEGIATTLTCWAKQIRLTAAPRVTLTQLPRGMTLGTPNDAAQQRRVLAATLALLAQDSPLELIQLDEEEGSWR